MGYIYIVVFILFQLFLSTSSKNPTEICIDYFPIKTTTTKNPTPNSYLAESINILVNHQKETDSDASIATYNNEFFAAETMQEILSAST